MLEDQADIRGDLVDIQEDLVDIQEGLLGIQEDLLGIQEDLVDIREDLADTREVLVDIREDLVDQVVMEAAREDIRAHLEVMEVDLLVIRDRDRLDLRRKVHMLTIILHNPIRSNRNC